MLLLAHAGHWLGSALYLTTVAILVVVLAIQSRRDPDGAHRPEDPT